MRASLTAVVVTTALILSGCASAAEVTAEPTDDSVYGGFPIDPPAPNEVVLTIEGSTPVDYTYDELQRRATVEIEILEPFVTEQQTFRGVPLAELLADAGVADDTSIETIALNDYRYVDTVVQWVDNGALLAVFRDDELIPMDQGGPIRIVFDEASPAYEVLDAWNWSLRTITVVD